MNKDELRKALKPLVRELMLEVLGERVLQEVVSRVAIDAVTEEQETLVERRVPAKTDKLVAVATSRTPMLKPKRDDGPFGADFLNEVAADHPAEYEQLRQATRMPTNFG